MHSHSHFLAPGQAVQPGYALLASFWALGTVLVLITIKAYAYWQSGSASVLATLMDSFMDGGVSLAMLLAIRLSLKPADKDHRHGHGKAEALAALFQSAFLAGGGCFLAFESLNRFFEPRVLEHHMIGIGVSAAAILLTLILVGVQKFCLKKAPSLAIEADHAHYRTDIFLNSSVMLALFADYQGWASWIDPVTALLVAGSFGAASFKIGKSATDMLMDKELPDAVRERIREIAKRHDDVLGLHDLRTRRSGMVLYLSMDIEIDPEFTLKEAHAVALALERDIMADYPHAEIMIHMDPYGIPHKESRHNVKGVHH
ncbi:MAG: cation diffusion facilitator family transporter [Rhodospirillales bacterium]|nr:cation diffusion facilitator family transporter [Alphaproteobacteria bacterium]USO04193.1 MAG: cation diffusion facilitator family transporter [Rhodospirillales bacterium]